MHIIKKKVTVDKHQLIGGDAHGERSHSQMSKKMSVE